MSISFSGGELINIAINIEKRGIAFYDIMAMSADNAAARHIFQNLADMEREHKEAMLWTTMSQIWKISSLLTLPRTMMSLLLTISLWIKVQMTLAQTRMAKFMIKFI